MEVKKKKENEEEGKRGESIRRMNLEGNERRSKDNNMSSNKS